MSTQQMSCRTRGSSDPNKHHLMCGCTMRTITTSIAFRTRWKIHTVHPRMRDKYMVTRLSAIEFFSRLFKTFVRTRNNGQNANRQLMPRDYTILYCTTFDKKFDMQKLRYLLYYS